MAWSWNFEFCLFNFYKLCSVLIIGHNSAETWYNKIWLTRTSGGMFLKHSLYFGLSQKLNVELKIGVAEFGSVF